MAIDTEAIAYHVKGILKALGEDPEREGLKETPERVARMYAEVFAGIAYSNHEIAEMFGKTFSKPETDAGQTVVTMKDISVFSYCEHHMALMYDMHVNVSYVPHGKVLGLSKVARICDLAAKRLQLQERLGQPWGKVPRCTSYHPNHWHWQTVRNVCLMSMIMSSNSFVFIMVQRENGPPTR